MDQETINFHKDNKEQLRIYKFPLFTKKAFDRIVSKKGSGFVTSLVVDSCAKRGCRFMGLKGESGYVYCYLGVEKKA